MRVFYLLFLVANDVTSLTTKMYFKNLCDYEFPVIRTIELWNRTWRKVEMVLKPNETKNTAYPLNYEWPNMNFRAGWKSKNAAEFFLNTAGFHWYGINIAQGFDTDMSIVPDDGFNMSCHSDNCPEGFKTPEDWRSKMHWVPVKTTFTTTFCAPVEKKDLTKRTTVFFNNFCSKIIDVVAVNKRGSGMVVYKLHPESYGIKKQGIEGSFKVGINGTTAVEIKLNDSSFDYYSINVERGFDYPVRVGAMDGAMLTCRDADCVDGIRNHLEYPEKVWSTPTGKAIHIIWCPGL